MITYVTGNLFESPAQTLVNTVNTVGVMGKGIALTFKKLFPEMFERYQEACEAGRLQIGSLFVWQTQNKLILNFPTKTDWRRPSKPEYIAAGLRTFRRNYEKIGVHSVAFPPLGCGNGELDFEKVVQPIMEDYLRDLPIPVYIYAPHRRAGLPEHRSIEEIRTWLRSTPADLPFDEMWQDLREHYARRTSIGTLSGRGRFEAEYLSTEDAIRVRTSSRTSVVTRDEFAELWNQLRRFGIVTPNAVSAARRKEGAMLLSVLAVLPYVQLVVVAQDFEAFHFNPTRGLQLKAVGTGTASSSDQLELV